MASSKDEGTQHHHSDYYGSENPIPKIQRFFHEGVQAIVARGGRALSDDEADSEDEDSDDDSDDSEASASSSSRPVASSSNGNPPERSASKRSKAKQRMSGLFGGRQKGHTEKAAASVASAHSDGQEKTPEQRAKEKDSKPGKQRGKPRQVYDPVTQTEITVTDMRKKDYLRSQKREDRRRQGKASDDPKNPAINIATGPFPPEQPLPATLAHVHPLLMPVWTIWAVGLVIYLRSFVAGAFILINAWLGWWAFRHIRVGVEDERWKREALRGQEAIAKGTAKSRDVGKDREGTKEAAEWLNSILQSMWQVIDPALFDPAAGTLEDIMSASAPGFIHAIKVSEVAHGTIPIRIAGVKILPDSEAEHVTPKEGKDDHSKSDRTYSGQHVNLEMAIIYHAPRDSTGLMRKHNNARLAMSFWIGVRKIATIPLPVWVEIKGFVGTVRARLQLTPDTPFVKNLTFTFLGLPKVSIEVVPLKVNLTNIPVLSGFVQSAIDAALAEYCAPSSMTMDLGEILMGDSIKREVHAVGVFVIFIHSATDLEKQDARGSSDPYVTISWARLGKIEYATRVALDDLNPRWEERHFMLLTPDAVRSKEKISLALWDSDRLTADDILGRIEVDPAHYIRRPGKLFHREDTLMGISNQQQKQGQLKWSIGFYRKVSNFARDKESNETEEKTTSETQRPKKVSPEGQETHLGPSAGQIQQQKEKRRGRRESTPGVDTPLEEDNEQNTSPAALLRLLDASESARQARKEKSSVEFQPPDPANPAGILSIQVHQIVDLEYATEGQGKRSSGIGGNQEAAAGQLVDDVEDENDQPDAPSSYVSIVLNDQTAMISRIKALNNAPFFNIGTERFIRNWQKAFVMVVVRDRRLREADAILGVVALKLADVFQENGTSQVTQYFSIGGGIGHGRVRLSVLFRPVEGMNLTKEKLGFDVGTMRVHTSPLATDLADAMLRACSLRMRTLAGQVKLPARHAHTIENGKSIEWKVPPQDLFLRVPSRRRYSAPFIFEFRRATKVGSKRSLVAASILWLQDVKDDDVFDASLPIYKGKPDLHRFLHNYHDGRQEEEALELGVEKIGILKVRLQFKSGIGAIHAKLDSNPDSKAVMQAWEACVAAGMRSGSGDFADKDFDGPKESELGGQKSQVESTDEEDEEETPTRYPQESDQSDGRREQSEDFAEHDEDDYQSLSDKFKKWQTERKVSSLCCGLETLSSSLTDSESSSSYPFSGAASSAQRQSRIQRRPNRTLDSSYNQGQICQFEEQSQSPRTIFTANRL